MLACVALGSLLGADKPKDEQKLQGPWTVVDAMRGDEVADDVVGHQLEFKGDSFVITQEGKTLYTGTFIVDADKPLKTIDFKHESGPLKGKTWLGIYKVSGDTLKICDNAGSIASPRPEGFDPKPKSGHVLVLFKRIVP